MVEVIICGRVYAVELHISTVALFSSFNNSWVFIKKSSV
jgi:hypothetical protein